MVVRLAAARHAQKPPMFSVDLQQAYLCNPQENISGVGHASQSQKMDKSDNPHKATPARPPPPAPPINRPLNSLPPKIIMIYIVLTKHYEICRKLRANVVSICQLLRTENQLKANWKYSRSFGSGVRLVCVMCMKNC